MSLVYFAVGIYVYKSILIDLYTYWMIRWPLKYTVYLSFPFDKFVYYLLSLSVQQ